MTRLRFSPEALAEFKEAVRYYNEQRPGRGKRFADAVSAERTLLKKQPGVGVLRLDGFRERTVHGWPYRLCYQHDADGILVLAVAHMSREPDYWKSR